MSLYVDDVVLFLRPAASDINTTTTILQLFEETSGLNTNMTKSSFTPIQCSPTEVEEVQQQIHCRVENFPIKYLGLPLPC
jgi:hypothetical protein